MTTTDHLLSHPPEGLIHKFEELLSDQMKNQINDGLYSQALDTYEHIFQCAVDQQKSATFYLIAACDIHQMLQVVASRPESKSKHFLVYSIGVELLTLGIDSLTWNDDQIDEGVLTLNKVDPKYFEIPDQIINWMQEISQIRESSGYRGSSTAPKIKGD